VRNQEWRSAGLLFGPKSENFKMATSGLVRYQRTGVPKLKDELKGKLYLAFRNSCADKRARYSSVGRRL
jgi:hypothetical protein